MSLRLVRRVRLPDGRIDEFEPALNADGYYVLADLAVHPKHNVSANQFYVKNLDAVAARIRRGGVRLRMRGLLKPNQRNLISADEIEIEEAPEKGVTDRPLRSAKSDEDPFAAFTEWSEPEDEEAFRDL